ncbi:hypothetical protein BC937DRAFT_91284 [Endogone sp. FLAS-F59071]|nr:hypothetical protein BC937DRAFT_91284 [Endogone sp. FLAS-F59071]|eukprot:RUS21851.1 hypothetical protein BC937DRAFT_91284 [Endogone sp. FLAS-F59071]
MRWILFVEDSTEKVNHLKSSQHVGLSTDDGQQGVPQKGAAGVKSLVVEMVVMCAGVDGLVEGKRLEDLAWHENYGISCALGTAVANGILGNQHKYYQWLLTQDVALFLISRGTDTTRMFDLPLVWAALHGFSSVFAQLVERYVPSVTSQRRYYWAATMLDPYCSRYGMPRYPNTHNLSDIDNPAETASPLDVALHAACTTGQLEMVKFILNLSTRFPVNVSSSNSFALRVSTVSLRTDIVNLLLSTKPRIHVDLLRFCLPPCHSNNHFSRKLQEIEIDEIRQIKRELFLMFTAQGGKLSSIDAVTALHVLHDRDTAGWTWWPEIIAIVSLECPIDAVISLVSRLLLEDKQMKALSLMEHVPKPFCLSLTCLLQIVTWWDSQNHRIDYDLVLDFVVQQGSPDLLRSLLLKDRDHRFCLSWVAQYVYSCQSISSLVQHILNENGITHDKANAVFVSQSTLADARSEYLRVTGLDPTNTSLDRSLSRRIFFNNPRHVAMLTALGADAPDMIEEYLDIHWDGVLPCLDALRALDESNKDNFDFYNPYSFTSTPQTLAAFVDLRRIWDETKSESRMLAALLPAPSTRLRVVRVMGKLPATILLPLFRDGDVMHVGKFGAAVTAAAADAGGWRAVRALLRNGKLKEMFRSIVDGRLRMEAVVSTKGTAIGASERVITVLGRERSERVAQVLQEFEFE